MIRKIVTALILAPLAVVLISFAVANRETVAVSFDPFASAEPSLSMKLPLYALILVLLVAGVIVGGIAAWLRQGKWRWRARLAESQARALKAENDALRRRDPGRPAGMPTAVDRAPRLSIPPPAG
jgi:uncharacterized integral membrane protein